MNYNKSGIDMMILEIFTMFDTAKVEIKKEHQLLMVGGNDFGETSLSHLEDQLPLDSDDCCIQTV